MVGPGAEETDILSTAVFVLGKEKGLGLINNTEGYEASIIDSSGKVEVSEGMREKYVKSIKEHL